jgi:hypothetical protein
MTQWLLLFLFFEVISEKKMLFPAWERALSFIALLSNLGRIFKQNAPAFCGS